MIDLYNFTHQRSPFSCASLLQIQGVKGMMQRWSLRACTISQDRIPVSGIIAEWCGLMKVSLGLLSEAEAYSLVQQYVNKFPFFKSGINGRFHDQFNPHVAVLDRKSELGSSGH